MARKNRIGRRERRERLDTARFRLDRVIWQLTQTVTQLRSLGEHEAERRAWHSIERLSECRHALVVRGGRR